MQSWIFQANPKVFKIDEFLASAPDQCLWRVSKYAREIGRGHRVFLWRALGKGARSDSGIFGRAEVIALSSPQEPGTAQEDFWIDQGNKKRREPRARIGGLSIGSTPDLSLAAVECDPILKNMGFLRNRQGTNFSILEQYADRLETLWANRAAPWSRDDLAVALQAGRLDPSLAQHGPSNTPVAEAAVRLGRTTSAVAARARMFLNLAAGSGTAPADLLAVWNEFLDSASSRLDEAKLDTEIARISAAV